MIIVIVRSKNIEIEKQVREAGLRLIKEDGFFAYAYLHIPVFIEDTGMDGTIYTNGQYIVFDTGNLEILRKTLQDISAQDALKHEIMHIALNHISRKEHFIERDGESLDYLIIAQEFVINREILQSFGNFVNLSFIKKHFNLTQKEIDGLPTISSEELAELLKKRDRHIKVKSSDWCLNPSCHVCGKKESEALKEEIKKILKKEGFENADAMVEDILRKAVVKNAGKGNSPFFKEIEALFEPKVNWRAILSDEIKIMKMQETAENGFKAVQRRYYQLKRFVPKMPIIFEKHKRLFDGIYIYIDTSGSISDEEYSHEISEVLELVKNEGVRGKVCLFDDGVRNEYRLDSRINIKELAGFLKHRTSGGTDLTEPFEKSEAERAKLNIVLSDLYANYPQKKQKTRTIFLTYTKEKPILDMAERYGKVIRLEMEK